MKFRIGRTLTTIGAAGRAPQERASRPTPAEGASPPARRPAGANAAMPSLREILPRWVSVRHDDPRSAPLVSVQLLVADAEGVTLSLGQILPAWVTVRLLKPLASMALPEPTETASPPVPS